MLRGWNNYQKGAKKVFAWAGGILLLLGAMFTGVRYIVHAETSDLRTDGGAMKATVAALQDDVHKLQSDLSKTNDDIKQYLNKALDRAFPAAKGTTPTRGTIENAGRVIMVAKSLNLKLDHVVLARFGSTVARLSGDPQLGDVAWASLKQAMDYRTFLNKDFIPMPKDLTVWPDKKSSYRPTVIISSMTPSNSEKQLLIQFLFAGGIVKSEYSARLEKLSDPQPMGSEIGIYVIEGVGAGITLDGMYMKNVIVRNAEVSYSGGPVRLENVSFVNCRFVFTKNRPTINLGEAILQANSVNFSTVTRPS